MDSKEKLALKLLEYYSKLLTEKSFSVTSPEKQNFAYGINVSNKKHRVALLVYFGKKGNKTVLQGNKESEIYKKLNEIIFGEKLFAARNDDINPDSYIGTDESGKGDYFGPLVIAGVFADPEISLKLLQLGVRDSKTISDWQIKKLASEIKKIANKDFDTISISPDKYNKLHEKMGNVNKILGWAHAKVLENILTNCDAEEAISDKFGNERLILDALQEKGKNLKLYQTSKAERFTAVAAASIIARDSVIRWFEMNSSDLGIKIPKGASGEVERTAKKVAKKFGKNKLNSLVKVHFKTSKKVFESI
ncbi:MAG: ribonuclease HIII [Ignavibacteria bacterium]|nr:ribonuclease HIII [Ignavibacteria bacterium]MBT8383045.1 ribonuclease HIII [Ignavibacteria bacterium]MBT8392566.1 ribonuclease HIII [Ignavibacteria bacterium]NNJ52038.1 ribonuclease HIII [Ignavibacteriaceae bacterium]NNL20846.1 ribonuclease HIII [Ignavibacteriaceae bacterium]